MYPNIRQMYLLSILSLKKGQTTLTRQQCCPGTHTHIANTALADDWHSAWCSHPVSCPQGRVCSQLTNRAGCQVHIQLILSTLPPVCQNQLFTLYPGFVVLKNKKNKYGLQESRLVFWVYFNFLWGWVGISGKIQLHFRFCLMRMERLHLQKMIKLMSLLFLTPYAYERILLHIVILYSNNLYFLPPSIPMH